MPCVFEWRGGAYLLVPIKDSGQKASQQRLKVGGDVALLDEPIGEARERPAGDGAHQPHRVRQPVGGGSVAGLVGGLADGWVGGCVCDRREGLARNGGYVYVNSFWHPPSISTGAHVSMSHGASCGRKPAMAWSHPSEMAPSARMADCGEGAARGVVEECEVLSLWLYRGAMPSDCIRVRRCWVLLFGGSCR